jgi:hypothetical protein
VDSSTRRLSHDGGRQAYQILLEFAAARISRAGRRSTPRSQSEIVHVARPKTAFGLQCGVGRAPAASGGAGELSPDGRAAAGGRAGRAGGLYGGRAAEDCRAGADVRERCAEFARHAWRHRRVHAGIRPVERGGRNPDVPRRGAAAGAGQGDAGPIDRGKDRRREMGQAPRRVRQPVRQRVHLRADADRQRGQAWGRQAGWANC